MKPSDIKILIVDDSLVARMSVKGCIKDQGHELAEAGDGLTALAQFKTFMPDVTFLDITMPDKSGLEVLEELRINYPEAVVIILSADTQKQTQERARQLGAFAIVKKPPLKEVVQEALARALVSAGVNHG